MENVEKQLFADISQLIEESKKAVAISVNVTLTTRNWRIGKRLKESILQQKRAEYGKTIVINLSKELIQKKF